MPDVEALRAEMATPEYAERKAQAERERKLDNALIPKALRTVSRNRIPDSAEHKMLIAKWVALVQETLSEGKNLPGLFLYGPPGSGKTSITAGLLRGFVLAGNTGLFLRYSEIHDVKVERTEYPYLPDYTIWDVAHSVRFLVIDDLLAYNDDRVGKYANAFVEELLRQRMSEGLSTIISSNYGLERIAELGSKRLVSVLSEVCYLCGIKDLDYRAALSTRKSLEDL